MEIIQNIRVLGPVFAFAWAVTIIFILWKPQRYFNSFLLIGALIVSMVFVSGFFTRDAAGYFLLACYLLIMLGLLLTPVLLIVNGVQMIRKESVCPAHLLSLGLGIAVGVGEVAAVIWVLGLSETVRTGDSYRLIMFTVLTVFYFSFLVLSFVIYSVFIQIMPHRMNFDYIVIHGCALADGVRPGRLLTARLDKAIEVWQKCEKKPFIIPSGGQGDDEKLSEAQSMANYLLEHGIPREMILQEDRSTTTMENLEFSKEIIDSRGGGRRIALVSSNYHVYRCLRYAAKIGLRCTGIGAKVALYYWPSALIREFVAVFVTKRFLIWSMIGYVLFICPVWYDLVFR